MKGLCRRRLVFLAAVMIGIGVPRLASADPVTVTSGFISIQPDCCTGNPLHLDGTDGVQPFSLTGFISSNSNISPRGCCSPTATTISLDIHSAGLDVPATVTYGNSTYPVGGGLDPEDVGGIVIRITGSAALPAAPATLNDVATTTGTFVLGENSGFGPPCCDRFPPGNVLRGFGRATVSLVADPGAGAPVWAFRAAEYRFTTQAPIPEPASFILLGSGLAGLVVRRRKKGSLPPAT